MTFNDASMLLVDITCFFIILGIISLVALAIMHQRQSFRKEGKLDRLIALTEDDNKKRAVELCAQIKALGETTKVNHELGGLLREIAAGLNDNAKAEDIKRIIEAVEKFIEKSRETDENNSKAFAKIVASIENLPKEIARVTIIGEITAVIESLLKKKKYETGYDDLSNFGDLDFLNFLESPFDGKIAAIRSFITARECEEAEKLIAEITENISNFSQLEADKIGLEVLDSVEEQLKIAKALIINLKIPKCICGKPVQEPGYLCEECSREEAEKVFGTAKPELSKPSDESIAKVLAYIEELRASLVGKVALIDATNKPGDRVFVSAGQTVTEGDVADLDLEDLLEIERTTDEEGAKGKRMYSLEEIEAIIKVTPEDKVCTTCGEKLDEGGLCLNAECETNKSTPKPEPEPGKLAEHRFFTRLKACIGNPIPNDVITADGKRILLKGKILTKRTIITAENCGYIAQLAKVMGINNTSG